MALCEFLLQEDRLELGSQSLAERDGCGYVHPTGESYSLNSHAVALSANFRHLL